MRLVFYLFAITIGLCISILVFLDKYNPLFIFWWFVSGFLLIIASWRHKKMRVAFQLRFSKKHAFFLLIITLPVVIRILSFNLNRLHGDDIFTAYFSATTDFLKFNFFAGVPEDKAQWVAQFPSFFFFLQRIFFTLFGADLLSVKLSAMPYVFIVSLFLFLIVKKISHTSTAIIALSIYAFLAVSLYHETLGLHFVSSTAIFLVFFYLLLLQKYKSNSFLAVCTGIICGLNYLFYLTSFIALPFMILYYFIQLAAQKNILFLKYLLLALFGWFIVLAPFISYNLKFENYLFSRMSQVSLLTGTWSGVKDEIALGKSPLNAVWENTRISLESLYADGIGGHGGYDFSHLALLNTFTRSLFITGVIAGLVLLIQGKREILYIYLVIVISYITGVILSTPHPAYHRFSLAFPFLSIVLALSFHFLFTFTKKYRIFSYSIILFLMAVYIHSNYSDFLKSTKSEDLHESLIVSNFINSSFPGRNIHIASFPGFGFEKVYYFSPGKNARYISTGYHDDYLTNFNPDEKYIYVIIYPDDFNSKFSSLDPKGRIFRVSQGYSLFVNE